jgi:hypothetical protein
MKVVLFGATGMVGPFNAAYTFRPRGYSAAARITSKTAFVRITYTIN